MKKILISEKILKELSIRKNDVFNSSAYSKVYFGNDWVKKISLNDSSYSDAEMYQFELMQNNPDIFPETKIKKFSKGTIILQKKINVFAATKRYDQISDFIPRFRIFLETLAINGKTPSNLNTIDTHKNNENFMSFVNVVTKLHELLKNASPNLKYRIDLHDENFGIENNKLKIIDFLTPQD